MTFADRYEAGRRLAAVLERYRNEEPVVFGLARGGVAVGFEVARALGAPLDVLVVRKLGAPGAPEFAIGAMAPGATLVDDQAVARLQVPRLRRRGDRAGRGDDPARALYWRGRDQPAEADRDR
jgi:predicted phosphoribosyltransferase